MTAIVPSFTDGHLESLKRRFVVTENPMYVWLAIKWCTTEYPFCALPDWCLDYLATAATNLVALSEGRDFRKLRERPALSASRDVGDRDVMTSANKIDWRKMTELIPAAMGLASKGKSAFRDAHAENRKARATINHLERKKRGEAASETRDAVTKQLGLSDPGKDGAALRTIRRDGQRLLRGVPGKTSR